MDTSFDAAPLRVLAGADCLCETRGLGVSTIQFKVSGQGSEGLFVLENTFHAKGGPARHLHHEQDEWFYVVTSDFQMEVGDERFTLHPSDSLLALRGTPMSGCMWATPPAASWSPLCPPGRWRPSFAQ